MRSLYIIIFLLTGSYVLSQNKYLSKKYPKVDSDKVQAMGEAIKNGDSALFFSLYTKNLRDAKAAKNSFLLSYCYDKLAIYNYYHGDLETAVLCYDTAVSVAKKNKLDDVRAGLHMNMGAILFTLRKYAPALNNYKAAEELMIKEKSPKIGGLLGNISLLYQEIGDLENAKRYLYRSIPFVKLDNEPDSYAKSMNNLGLIFKKEKNYRSADSMFKIAYNYTKEHKLPYDFFDVAYNYAEVCYLQKKLKQARDIEEELLPQVENVKGRSWVKLLSLDLAKICFEMKDVAASKKYMAKAESIELGNIDGKEIQDQVLIYAEMNYLLGQFEKSATAFRKFVNVDQNDTKQKDVIGLQQLSYQFEKQQDSLENAKEKAIIALENQHEQEKAESKLRLQRIIIFVSLAGFVLIIGFVISLIKANRSKEKANKEISHQKGLLAEKNKEITDSINYAQRIQHSLLPPLDLLEILLPKHFLLYMPKDIVSGDFYWTKKLNANELFVAVADCTGHGVPGAMMSALSIQNLNELCMQTRSPGELLGLLNNNLRNTLNQDQEGFSKDGLDICICKIQLKERKIIYAGANRSLTIFNSKGLKTEMKATKAGIGGHTPAGQKYVEHEISMDENDMAVLSTDGFADQFGGSEGKKITTKRFKEWLSNIVSSDRKKEELSQRFLAWKGNSDQIDDVCVLGFKI